MDRTDLVLLGAVLLLASTLVSRLLLRRAAEASGDNQYRLDVATLVASVRRELVEASQRTVQDGGTPMFAVKSFDLEVQFVVEDHRKLSGSIDYKVVTVGGEHEQASGTTHKIVLHMDTIGDGVRPGQSLPSRVDTHAPAQNMTPIPPVRRTR